MTKNEALRLERELVKAGFTYTGVIRGDGNFKTIGQCPVRDVTKIFECREQFVSYVNPA